VLSLFSSPFHIPTYSYSMKYSNTEEGRLRIYNSIICYVGKMMKEENHSLISNIPLSNHKFNVLQPTDSFLQKCSPIAPDLRLLYSKFSSFQVHPYVRLYNRASYLFQCSSRNCIWTCFSTKTPYFVHCKCAQQLSLTHTWVPTTWAAAKNQIRFSFLQVLNSDLNI